MQSSIWLFFRENVSLRPFKKLPNLVTLAVDLMTEAKETFAKKKTTTRGQRFGMNAADAAAAAVVQVSKIFGKKDSNPPLLSVLEIKQHFG